MSAVFLTSPRLEIRRSRSRAIETGTQAVTRSAPQPPRKLKRHALNAGAPRFNYSLDGAGGIAAAVPPPADSSVSFGG